MTTKNILRFASLAAVLLAGSCASPNDTGGLTAEGAANHPITVEPTSQALNIAFAGPNSGLSAPDEQRVDAFVSDYLARGNGAISISVPQGPDASDTVTWFGEHFAEMGVPRSRILVGMHDGGSVELSYVSYVAHTEECGDWSANIAETASNMPMPNFGCATQHNLAAQVADPRDLLTPRKMDGADAKRRATVADKYEKGQITASDKSQEQSAAVADVNKQ
jgi:pilus assembly protein CpaD